MKVLHISPSYFPAFQHGGVVESVHLLNKTLVRAGITLDVITTDKTSYRCNLDGVNIKCFPYYFYKHYNFSPQLFFSVLNEVKKYDLVHITAFWNFPVLAGSVSSLLYKKPYIISPRGVLYEEAINIKSKRIKKLYYYLIAKHYLKFASAVHYTSEDERDNISSLFRINNKSLVIPNGLDLDQYKTLPPAGTFKSKYPVLKDKRYILFLGRIHKKKGLDILVDAFKDLINFDNDLSLVIAGPDNGGYEKFIKAKLNNYGLSKKVLFTGLIRGKEKLAAFVDANLFILSSYSENFGMSVIEAMACGTPVIVSNKVGIYKDIQDANAGYVVTTNANSVASGIKKLLSDNALCTVLSTNGKKLLKDKYDIEMVSKMMINAYEDIMKR
ncbi:MAG: glycosyltransferase [Candidatus Melainabacteria bacterium]|nr:glycosyltransferase [Candidatus Melainabacteria bacterium]